MQKHIIGGLLHLAAACSAPAALAEETTLDLSRGHFLVRMDAGVESYALRALPQPHACLPALALERQAGGAYRVVSSDPDCQTEPYAELLLNPDWSPALHIQLSGGQIDFASSLWDSLSTLQASVSMGDIFGPDGVQRYRLLGARLALDRQRVGIRLRVSVGAGQITLDMPPRQSLSSR
ncbi:hypothetical protein [Janthinobacterium agaricidamnosum]|uniref:Transmembrane protein n=1 Tax=Janthinobacterium agaricidamnosum NBRC 102515 = DSM 9628 TaxID=1349767 RepID=W0VDD4_9BURK|nr:hypothetical protein [Janthinobacterium agaricidamnosum]CDG85921.1 hypothetical protein GJA_5325 [Janthinobacterium agaricidamnosum NBRC 102515 = DSM 9628]